MIAAVLALAFVLLAVYTAQLGTVPPLVWILLISTAIALLAVSLLNLYVRWDRAFEGQPITPTITKEPKIEAQPTVADKPAILSEKISFGYLPRSPLDNGWIIAYRDDDAHPTFSATHVSGETRLAVLVRQKFAMDYPIVAGAKFARRVTFSAKFTANTMIFLAFDLKSEDGKSTVKRDVKLKVGSLPAQLTKDYPSEYTLWVEGLAQADGWMSFDLSLPEVIRQTWQNLGWHYESLLTVRLRGSLSISPISFWSS